MWELFISLADLLESIVILVLVVRVYLNSVLIDSLFDLSSENAKQIIKKQKEEINNSDL